MLEFGGFKGLLDVVNGAELDTTVHGFCVLVASHYREGNCGGFFVSFQVLDKRVSVRFE